MIKVEVIGNYFNSIKVRLEPRDRLGLSWLLRYFNSIKVRLEQQQIIDSMQEVIDFNSIKVRLELPRTHDIDFESEFQFHKGTIRTG